MERKCCKRCDTGHSLAGTCNIVKTTFGHSVLKINRHKKMEYVICKTVIAIGQFVNQSANTYNYTMYSIHIPMTESLY